MNLRLIATMSLLCTFNVFVYGMKRNIVNEKDLILPANSASLPQETLEQIFTYLCQTPIDISIVKAGFFYSWSDQAREFLADNNCYFSPKHNWKIAPNGIVACLARMRSVCKHWHDTLLSPTEIKRRLSIDTADIVTDLMAIEVNESQKNYFHVQFLAEMVRGQRNACCYPVPNLYRYDNDSVKLKILLENGIIDLSHQRLIDHAVEDFRWNRIARRAIYPIAMGILYGIGLYLSSTKNSSTEKLGESIGLNCQDIALNLDYCDNKYSHPLAKEAFCTGQMPGDEETYRRYPYLISNCIELLYDYCKCYYNKP